MNEVYFNLLEEKYNSKFQELDAKSLQISTIFEAIVESRAIDWAVSPRGATSEPEISLAAGRMIDSAYLSRALHAFYAAKMQKIAFDLSQNPPNSLNGVVPHLCSF